MTEVFKTNWNKKENYWDTLLESILPNTGTKPVGFYDLIYSFIDENALPIKLTTRENEREHYAIFTSKEDLLNSRHLYESCEKVVLDKDVIHKPEYKIFMLGDFVDKIKQKNKPTPIRLNPILVGQSLKESKWMCQNIIMAPLFDELTHKFMTTNPDDALALLAIHPDDQKRFGIEMVFHIISNHSAPEPGEERDEYLLLKINELAFIAPRVPIKKGSGSVLCIVLNLDNKVEETAFIRSYQTLDPHSDIIFVNSNLELMTGDMQPIKYNGEQIDTIFSPIINWQNNKLKTPIQVTSLNL